MKRNASYVLLILVLFAFVLRIWGIADVKSFMGDEGLHIPAAENYCKNGHYAPDKFFHPPLKYSMLYGSMKIFGNNPYGWRMRNVLLGTSTILILFILAKELFSDIRVAYLAGALLSIDPLHISQSRSTVDEIPVILFFLICCYAAIKYLKGSSNIFLFVAGFFFGLAISTKWYFLPELFILTIFILICKVKENGWKWKLASDIFSACVLLPLSIYLLAFYAWFGRGYDLFDFFRNQIDAFKALTSLTVDYFVTMGNLFIPPSEWFVRPIFYGFHVSSNGIWRQYHVDINNFPIWLLTLPALLYMAYETLRYKDRYAFLFLVVFMATYLQLLLIKRPLYVYSALVILPFTILSVSFLIVSSLRKLKRSNLCYNLVLIAIFLWGLYLYPLILGKYVPGFLYAPLLSIGKIYSVY